mgnify:CR=1 FL=1
MYLPTLPGEQLILECNEALVFGDRLKSSLINPNQLRANGVTVSDISRQFDKKSTHSTLGIDQRGRMVDLPLSLRGIISYLLTVYPTDEQLNTCSHITLTSSEG